MVKVVRDPDDDDTKKERRPEEKEKNKFESAAFPECRIRAIRVDTQKELEEEKRHLRPSLSLVRPVLTFAQYDTLNYTTPLKDLFRVSYLGNLRTGRRGFHIY